MKNRLLMLWVLLLCTSTLVTGCKADNNVETSPIALPITIAEQIPYAQVGETYDISSLIAEQDGITYEYTATFIDPESGEEKVLNVRKGKITPRANADISVIITATNGKNYSSAELMIPIKVSSDIMDDLLAKQATDGVAKTVIKDAAYIHGENSSSSLSVTFDDSATLINLHDHVLHPYYSSQVWNNAAVSFHVYNPMEQDVSFKIESVNTAVGKTLTWESKENTQIQIAKGGQWSHIKFSLYDMDITQPLFDAVTYTKEDLLQVCAQYSGSETCTIYIDQLDIVCADTIGLQTGYKETPIPAGDWSQLLNTCHVYTADSVATLEKIAQDTYCFGSTQQAGYPTFFVDFPRTTDISGFEYLKFDILGENCYPYLAVSIRYLDENGNVKHKGTYYDYYSNQWQTIYLNLSYLQDADLTKAIGISFSVHMDKNFVAGQFNSVSFKNVALYDFPNEEPQIQPAVTEDNDIISGTFYTTGTKPNINGVCKVSADEKGISRSNSSLMFWTNNACGYPNVEAFFLFDTAQNWSDKEILSFDTHQAGGHYWLQFDIYYLDENGNQQTAMWRYDTIMSNWQTNHASLDWFKTPDGTSIKPEKLTKVVGFRIQANMAINVTSEVAQIFFDNFVLS